MDDGFLMLWINSILSLMDLKRCFMILDVSMVFDGFEVILKNLNFDWQFWTDSDGVFDDFRHL